MALLLGGINQYAQNLLANPVPQQEDNSSSRQL
jgi:hypothetical protein